MAAVTEGGDGAEVTPGPAFMSALVTEHFALQSVSSATISESGSRAGLYLSSLSSGLVAIGFARSAHRSFAALACTVLPTVFGLGWFTVVRLVDTSTENIVCRRRIELIRSHYAGIDPCRQVFFQPDYGAAGLHGVRYRGRSVLFTMTSVVHLVNSVVGGATVALICIVGGHLTATAGVVVAVLAGIGFVAVGLGYLHRRSAPLIAGIATGSTPPDLT